MAALGYNQQLPLCDQIGKGTASNSSLASQMGWGATGNADGSAYYLGAFNNIWIVDPANGSTTLHQFICTVGQSARRYGSRWYHAYLSTNAGLAVISNFRQVGESVAMVTLSGASTTHWDWHTPTIRCTD